MEIIQQFGVNKYLLAAQVVNFFILLFLLRRFLYNPLLKVLQERKQRIADSLKNAEQIQKELEKTETERDKKLAKATDEARKIIEDTQKDATQLIAEATHQAQLQVQSLIEKGQQQIESDRLKMQQQLKDELSVIVTLALKKITGKTLDKKDQQKLLDQTINEL